MKKRLSNTAKTKKYLDKLPKVYAVCLWAKWAVIEVPWTGKYDKDGMPLVYMYHDFNGECDEYLLVPIRLVSSGFYYWYKDKETADNIRTQLNNKEVKEFTNE